MEERKTENYTQLYLSRKRPIIYANMWPCVNAEPMFGVNMSLTTAQIYGIDSSV